MSKHPADEHPFAGMQPPPAKVPPDPKPEYSEGRGMAFTLLLVIVVIGAVVYYISTKPHSGTRVEPCQNQVPDPTCPHSLHKLEVVNGAALCLCPDVGTTARGEP